MIGIAAAPASARRGKHRYGLGDGPPEGSVLSLPVLSEILGPSGQDLVSVFAEQGQLLPGERTHIQFLRRVSALDHFRLRRRWFPDCTVR